jgi:hypothetical protein
VEARRLDPVTLLRYSRVVMDVPALRHVEGVWQ